MDLLLAAGYDSSSSSSTYQSKNHDSLRESYKQNALNGHTPDNSPGLGNNDNYSSSASGGYVAKRGRSCQLPRSPAVIAKKRKVAQLITIASSDSICKHSEQCFERCKPHWEGRWTGHIYLPFPNEDSLDSNFTHYENDPNTLAGKDDSDSNSDESSIEEEELEESRTFLPTARALIHYCETMLNEAFVDISDISIGSEIVPHILMSQKVPAKQERQMNNTCHLHISLSRSIYLPSQSVESFLAEVSSSLTSFLSSARSNSMIGKTIYLRPHNATIFVNEKQTRSFLSIPISDESSCWIKRVLLPPIDATMIRFGQTSYYDEGILHVSIASVKGNVIPMLLKTRRQADFKQGVPGNESMIKSIPLFPMKECTDDVRTFIPESIPIKLDRIQCDFGKVKNVALPL